MTLFPTLVATLRLATLALRIRIVPPGLRPLVVIGPPGLHGRAFFTRQVEPDAWDYLVHHTPAIPGRRTS